MTDTTENPPADAGDKLLPDAETASFPGARPLVTTDDATPSTEDPQTAAGDELIPDATTASFPAADLSILPIENETPDPPVLDEGDVPDEVPETIPVAKPARRTAPKKTTRPSKK